MLTIRTEQLKIFSQVEVEKFEVWMLGHLKKFFPVQCQAAGDKQLHLTVRSGIERAASYRITAKRDVCKYIDLMVVFGRDFDTDKRLPWAREILATGKPSAQKIRDLHQAALRHLRRT